MRVRTASIILLSCILTACQKDKPQAYGNLCVHASASLQEEPMSRAPYYATVPSTGNPLEAAIWASSTQYSYPHNELNDGRTDGTVTIHTSARFQSGSSQLISGVYYNAENIIDLYFIGLHPSDGWTWNADDNSASYTFNGSQDVMFAPETTGRYQGSKPHLAFKHLLTQIGIEIKAESEAVISAWGKITEMNIESHNGVSIDLSREYGAASSAEFSNPTTLNFYKNGSDEQFPDQTEGYTMTTDYENLAYTLCAPVAAFAEDLYDPGVRIPEYYINIRSEHREVRIPIDLMYGDESYYNENTRGKHFTLKLLFKMGNTIAVSASINDWETGGIGIGKIEE